MNFDEITIGQARALSKIFSQDGPSVHGAIGKKCVVRTYASGVHFGTVVSVSENGGRSRCELRDSRRIWKWGGGGLSLSEVSQNGLDPTKSRLSMFVPTQYIEDAIEFIPASKAAIKIIEETKADEV